MFSNQELPGGRSGTRNVSSRHATLNVIVRTKVAVYRSTGDGTRTEKLNTPSPYIVHSLAATMQKIATRKKRYIDLCVSMIEDRSFCQFLMRIV